MIEVTTISAVREHVSHLRASGGRVAFVPTMGDLHEGHLHLIDEAKKQAPYVVVSIFVNPMQFATGSDYDSYPRAIAEDKYKLKKCGVDLVFVPSVIEMYPDTREQETRVEVQGLSDVLCGQFRPGHFVGVTTVVNKLFNIVQADIALFGKKDYQQLIVIKKMVKDLCIPIKIVGVETTRETDGLAMSSRNQYLSMEERKLAPRLYEVLLELKQGFQSQSSSIDELESAAMESLADSGFRPEYISVCDADSLQPATLQSHQVQVLAAAWLGKARLIDNIKLR